MPTEHAPIGESVSMVELGKQLAESSTLDATPDAVAEPAPTPSAPAPTAPDLTAAIPELEEVRRVYGEAGVLQVVAEVQRTRVAQGHQVLNEKIPGWRDPETRAELQREIVAKARAEGFSDAEIQGADERAVLLAYQALRRDKERAQRRLTDTPDDSERPARSRQRTTEQVTIGPMGTHAAAALFAKSPLVD